MFHYILLAVCTFLFLSTWSWPIRALFKVICKRKKEEKSGPRSARWLAWVMSLLFVVFLIGMISTLSDVWEISYGVPSSLKVLLVLPLISAVLALGVLIFTILAWKNKYWFGCGRLHYTLILVAAAVFIWFLNYWNLLGFRF